MPRKFSEKSFTSETYFNVESIESIPSISSFRNPKGNSELDYFSINFSSINSF